MVAAERGRCAGRSCLIACFVAGVGRVLSWRRRRRVLCDGKRSVGGVLFFIVCSVQKMFIGAVVPPDRQNEKLYGKFGESTSKSAISAIFVWASVFEH